MNQQQFKKLDAKEKNEFLSNDMSERIMRVEQKVSANFGRLLHYNNTEYYKSLTPVQKESFEKYLRSKKKKRILICFLFIAPILFLFLLNIKFTGNAINDNFGSYVFLNYVLIYFTLLSFLIAVIYLSIKRTKNNKIDGYFGIIDNVLYSKKSGFNYNVRKIK